MRYRLYDEEETETGNTQLIMLDDDESIILDFWIAPMPPGEHENLADEVLRQLITFKGKIERQTREDIQATLRGIIGLK